MPYGNKPEILKLQFEQSYIDDLATEMGLKVFSQTIKHNEREKSQKVRRRILDFKIKEAHIREGTLQESVMPPVPTIVWIGGAKHFFWKNH